MGAQLLSHVHVPRDCRIASHQTEQRQGLHNETPDRGHHRCKTSQMISGDTGRVKATEGDHDIGGTARSPQDTGIPSNPRIKKNDQAAAPRNKGSITRRSTEGAWMNSGSDL